MKRSWLHVYAILVAVSTLGLFLTGAFVTSNEERPLYFVGHAHTAAGASVAILTIGLIVWLLSIEKRPWMRRLSWAALGILAAECLLGLSLPGRPLPMKYFHAFLAYLYFSVTAVIALWTAPGWAREVEGIEEQPRRLSLQSLALAASAAVVAQVSIGVAFRYDIVNVITHILTAMVVVVLSLAATLRASVHFLTRPALRLAGVTAITTTLLQVLLGVVVLSIQVINPDDPLPVILGIAAHVLSAALALAASVIFAIQIHRHVRSTAAKRDESMQG